MTKFQSLSFFLELIGISYFLKKCQSCLSCIYLITFTGSQGSNYFKARTCSSRNQQLNPSLSTRNKKFDKLHGPEWYIITFVIRSFKTGLSSLETKNRAFKIENVSIDFCNGSDAIYFVWRQLKTALLSNFLFKTLIEFMLIHATSEFPARDNDRHSHARLLFRAGTWSRSLFFQRDSLSIFS